MLQPEPFGRYLLYDRLCTGGMAAVYLAKEAQGGGEQVLAIKRILPELSDDAEFTRMFIDEAHISVSLAHANIGQVLDFGQADGLFYLAMEYIAGRDLRGIQIHLRETERVMELPLVLHVVARLCQALDYAHRVKDDQGKPLGIVHRDVSPPNVLLSFAGAVKLIDFGIAKARSRASRTRAGQLKGKLAYMAPEHILGQQVDHRADLFSLGIVMHELLTNQHLFGATEQAELLEQVRQGEIRPPSAINPDVPLEIDRIVLKALARDPVQRYGWASEFRADIERYIARTSCVVEAEALAGWMQREFAGDLEAERRLLLRLQGQGEALSEPAAAPALAEDQRGDTEPRRRALQEITERRPLAADEDEALVPWEAPVSLLEEEALEVESLPEVPAFELEQEESTLVSRPELLDRTEVSVPDTEPRVRLAALAAQTRLPFDSTEVSPAPVLELASDSSLAEPEPGSAEQGTRTERPQANARLPELLGGPLEELEAEVIGDRGMPWTADGALSACRVDVRAGQSAQAAPPALPVAIAPGPDRASKAVGGALDISSRPRRPTPAVDPAQPVDVEGLEAMQLERLEGSKPSFLATAVRVTSRVLPLDRRVLSSAQLIGLGAVVTLLVAGLVLLLLNLLGPSSAGGPASGKGSLIVTATPAATCSVTVDGRARGVLKPGASLSLTGVPVGKHLVILQCLGFESFAAEVEVKEAEASFVSGALRAK